MVTTKQLNIKKRTYYFYNDLINLKDFNPNLLKLDKKSFNDISRYYTGYVTKKTRYNISSVNPLYILIDEIDGFIEEKGDKYLNIALTDSNSGMKDQIKKIHNSKLGEYRKDYMKNKFNSDDDLPLNKVLKFRILIIIIRNIFEKGGKYYPGIYLDDCLYEI